MRTCDGHGTCTRSHRPHQLLQGIQPSTGRFFTIVAEPYPRKLCRRLVEAYAESIEERYDRHALHQVLPGKVRRNGNETLYVCGTGNEAVSRCPNSKRVNTLYGRTTDQNRLPGDLLKGETNISHRKGPPAYGAYGQPRPVACSPERVRLKPGYKTGFGKTSGYDWVSYAGLTIVVRPLLTLWKSPQVSSLDHRLTT